MDELRNYNCINYSKLLIIKAKELNISDLQSHILLIIMTMKELNIRPINPQTISKLSTLSIKQIDELLLSLLDMHLISRKRGQLDLSPLYDYLVKQEVVKDEGIDLLTVFEDAFGRTLNQRELEIINSFKRAGYHDEMIIDALNEAVKSGVMNFRYIEKILENWSRYGVNKRFAKEPVKEEQNVSNEVKDYNWWDQHD